jgi:uncharacterized protein YdbL (DUF1318 family)
MKTLPSPALLPALLVLSGACAGCLAIKTEHEVKPIQITMDVNLKVDKELDKEIEKEKKEPPRHMAELKAMSDRGAVGMDNRGYLVARGDLSDDEKDIVEDMNAKRRVRIGEIAESTGAKRADVEKMRAEKMVEHLPAGAWYQDAAGAWKQK